MSNFVSSNNANALFDAVGKKKLTVTDVMPLAASAANEGIPYLYLGATTQDYTNGSIYKCQEVTPATDPKTYEFVEIYQSNVDLSKYKRIWGGTEAAWEQLTDEEKAQYDYEFFEGDADYDSVVVDALIDGDMRPVTSNAVYDAVSKHIFGTAEDISGYTGTNYYLVPADGYGYIINTTGETRLYALNADKSTGIAIGANKSIASLYVKKGMYLTLNTLSGTLTLAKFYPLE